MIILTRIQNLLLLITGLLLLTGCGSKYGSFYEAKTACREWESKGKDIGYKVRVVHPDGVISIGEKTKPSRKCLNESTTNQVLGLIEKEWESNPVSYLNNGQPFSMADYPEPNYVVTKRFGY